MKNKTTDRLSKLQGSKIAGLGTINTSPETPSPLSVSSQGSTPSKLRFWKELEAKKELEATEKPKMIESPLKMSSPSSTASSSKEVRFAGLSKQHTMFETPSKVPALEHRGLAETYTKADTPSKASSRSKELEATEKTKMIESPLNMLSPSFTASSSKEVRFAGSSKEHTMVETPFKVPALEYKGLAEAFTKADTPSKASSRSTPSKLRLEIGPSLATTPPCNADTPSKAPSRSTPSKLRLEISPSLATTPPSKIPRIPPVGNAFSQTWKAMTNSESGIKTPMFFPKDFAGKPSRLPAPNVPRARQGRGALVEVDDKKAFEIDDLEHFRQAEPGVVLFPTSDFPRCAELDSEFVPRARMDLSAASKSPDIYPAAGGLGSSDPSGNVGGDGDANVFEDDDDKSGKAGEILEVVHQTDIQLGSYRHVSSVPRVKVESPIAECEDAEKKGKGLKDLVTKKFQKKPKAKADVFSLYPDSVGVRQPPAEPTRRFKIRVKTKLPEPESSFPDHLSSLNPIQRPVSPFPEAVSSLSPIQTSGPEALSSLRQVQPTKLRTGGLKYHRTVSQMGGGFQTTTFSRQSPTSALPPWAVSTNSTQAPALQMVTEGRAKGTGAVEKSKEG